MKFLLTLLFVLFCQFSEAGLNYSTDGKILDPGMYWAIHARNELNDYKKKGKGDRKKIMRLLKLSASYGFKASMLGISVIYQNGDYGQERDLPRAYAWWILSMGNKTGRYSEKINSFKKAMTQEQNVQAEQLLVEFSKTYSQEATLKKFEKWYDEVTTVTGSRVKGDHSYLNLQITTPTGRRLTAFEFLNQLRGIQEAQLDDLYEVIPNDIQLIENDDADKEDRK